jgi:hypothetical protein
MKLRHYLVIFAGILLTVLVFSIGSIATYQPNHYDFLGSNKPKISVLEPDPIGLVGREVRYYVVDENPAAVAAAASIELQEIGWKQLNKRPAVFGRGKHERIDVRGADQYNDKKLLAGIPANELRNRTVIKVIDPRMSPAVRHRFARIAKRVRHLQG